MKSIAILTGAGISAESGIKTFRDANGLWENHHVEDVASPDGFARDPQLVFRFYNERRRQLHVPELKPNAAHLALVELEKKWPGDFLLITQNVDNLHERAGSQKLLHMHGELMSAKCLKCQKSSMWPQDLDHSSVCPKCRKDAGLRPDIVWFGEMPYFLDKIFEFLENCDLFVAIGTSGLVYPAAGFVQAAHRATKKIEVNLADTGSGHLFDEQWLGPASLKVPELVQSLLPKI